MWKALPILGLVAGTMLGAVKTEVKPAIYFDTYYSPGQPWSFGLMAGELQVETRLASAERDILTLNLQLFATGTMSGWARALHFGNAYVVFPLGIGLPNIKVGQQVLPFGLLATYDTHATIVQTPYVQTLGLRIDTGIALLGIAGPVDYWLMVGNGRGPGLTDGDADKVVTGRIAHTWQLAGGDIKTGLSALHGILPRFALDADPLVDMMAEPDTLLAKTRLALDGEVNLGRLILRGEVVSGQDGSAGLLDHPALGTYAEARFLVLPALELLAAHRLWQPDLGQPAYAQGVLAGFNILPAIGVWNLQLAYEHDWQHVATDRTANRITAMLTVGF